ncbi:RagB/SusD family nutrient uptake outer membrane protein [Sphingobacterium multivorum]|uniref:RagB/SusD family nutrient uptake outer membrane protein n=1 Tax=Sphingobacterium multivorum TaxID=28454 RepID=UPI003DA55B7D
MKKTNIISILLGITSLLFSACAKFLEEKSDKALSIPITVEDYQAMLNNFGTLNTNFIAAGEVSSDDYYLTDADYNGLFYESDKRLYTWKPDFIARPQSSAGDEWYNCYQAIYVCNSVLHGLEQNSLSGAKADNIKGQAFVFRASRYLDGMQIWSPSYNEQTADKDLGMVLRLDPDINITSVRSTVKQTYNLIVEDLTAATKLLSDDPLGPTIPTKDVAYGLLARTYLCMGKYGQALRSAENALKYTDAKIVDFNKLDPDSEFPIPAINNISEEMMMWSVIFYSDQLDNSIARITPDLYALYDNNDLRRAIYFGKNEDRSYFFKGSHLGGPGLVNSPTPAEMLLIVAECNARLGNLAEAATALNQLMVKRIQTNNFTPISFASTEIALDVILKERRKELVMRGLRWSDIKRLNKEGSNISLTRKLDGQTYILPSNDPRFAIAIPETVIEISGILQNPR